MIARAQGREESAMRKCFSSFPLKGEAYVNPQHVSSKASSQAKRDHLALSVIKTSFPYIVMDSKQYQPESQRWTYIR